MSKCKLVLQNTDPSGPFFYQKWTGTNPAPVPSMKKAKNEVFLDKLMLIVKKTRARVARCEAIEKEQKSKSGLDIMSDLENTYLVYEARSEFGMAKTILDLYIDCQSNE